MSVVAKRDARVFRAKVARVIKQRPAARLKVLRDLTSQVVARVNYTANRDTNRNIRGVLMAANDVRAGAWPVPSVQPSKYAKKYEEIVRHQLRVVENGLAAIQGMKTKWYTEKGRKPDKFFRGLERSERKLQKKRERIVANMARLYESGGASVVIGASATSSTGGQFFHRQGERFSGVARVISKAYGGTGRIIGSGDRTALQLHNLEPHASIVEKREKNIARAFAAVRGLGLRKLGPKYAAEVAKGTGWMR